MRERPEIEPVCDVCGEVHRVKPGAYFKSHEDWEAWRWKLSHAMVGRVGSLRGGSHSPETRAKMRAAWVRRRAAARGDEQPPVEGEPQ